MKTVFTVFERDPNTNYTGILVGVYTSKDLALADVVSWCQDGDKWAAEQAEKFPENAPVFTNTHYTVSEDILRDGTAVSSEEMFAFHQNTRFFQMYDWIDGELVAFTSNRKFLEDLKKLVD